MAEQSTHAKQSDAARSSWADPEVRARRVAGIRAKREAIAEANKKAWADPQKREARLASIRATAAKPEQRAKRAAISTAQWRDPATRAKHIDGLTGAHAEGRMGDYQWFKGLSGDETSQWTGDDVGYRGAHQRIALELGKASEYPCVDCSHEANEWSFIERKGHSPRIEDYEPRCYSCHRRYDRALDPS